MLLALDVGNTEITAGLFHGPELSAHWRLTTTTERTPDEWSVTLNALLVQAGHSPNEVRAAVMASVAPSVTQSLIAGLRSATGSETTTVDATTRLPIRLDVDEPLTVGADRIINTLAALINGCASIYFLFERMVDFRAAGLMAAGAIVGGFAGAQIARRTKPSIVRWLVIVIGLGLSVLLAIRHYVAR